MQSSQIIETKYGNASLTPDGYYRITSEKEGNLHKLLHRVVFEDFYQIVLPENVVIHHIDGDKTNNNIWNLEPMTFKEHTAFHNRGLKHPIGHRINRSKATNKSRYYRVFKFKDKGCTQGFRWIYKWYENGKYHQIYSVDLMKLKEKVLARGLPWIEYGVDDT